MLRGQRVIVSHEPLVQIYCHETSVSNVGFISILSVVRGRMINEAHECSLIRVAIEDVFDFANKASIDLAISRRLVLPARTSFLVGWILIASRTSSLIDGGKLAGLHLLMSRIAVSIVLIACSSEIGGGFACKAVNKDTLSMFSPQGSLVVSAWACFICVVLTLPCLFG
jgi:hypothetical protein